MKSTVVGHQQIYYVVVGAIVLVAAGLRFYGLQESGVIFMDDLRAYVGPQIVEVLSTSNEPFSKRIVDIYRISVEGTGARPALAWLVALPSLFGLTTIGELYFVFALCGVLNIFLVWLLCKNSFDMVCATFAALWLSLSAAHVSFSRSALPATPAMTVILLGLIVMFKKQFEIGIISKPHLLLMGACFAIAMAFHPAYVVYILVPLIFVIGNVARTVSGFAEYCRELMVRCILLGAPSAILIIGYDAPYAIARLSGGQFEPADLVYLKGLYRLFTSPTIYSSDLHEGFLFLPKYVLAAEGALGFGILCFAMLTFAVRLASRERERTQLHLSLFVWIVVPYLVFALWPQLNSYGRLYAPTLPALAVLVGIGLSSIGNEISRFIPVAWGYVFVGFILAGSGIYAAVPLLTTSGKEPELRGYLERNKVKEVIAFYRTDARALGHLKIHMVFDRGDVNRVLCERKTTMFLLSPAPMHLILRHSRFLFDELQLRPVFTYTNPYRIPLRLMEGYPSKDRKRVLKDPEFAELGLFTIGLPDVCRSPTQLR